MGDLSSLLANAGQTNADWNALPNINKSYWEGLDQNAKQKTRDVFKDGFPTDADGNPDYSAASKKLYQLGDIDKGNAVSTLGVQRDQLKADQQFAQSVFPSAGGPPPNLPPSTSRTSSTVVAPPISGGQPAARSSQPQATATPTPGQPTGDRPGSIVGLISSAGIPDELAGPVIAQVSALTRTDPNAPIDPSMAPRVAQIVQAQVARMKQGQQGAQPPVQPAPPQPATTATADPTLGGLVPAGRTPQQQLDLLSRAATRVSPAQAKVYQERISAITAALQPTPDMKNASASGMPLKDYLDRSDDNTTQRDILTKSILPKIDASQEKAVAARDDINSIYRAREELDRPGSVFSGSFADQRLYLNKVASALGISDTDKIANTEAYGAAIGQRVASMVKAFGSGTAISDGDRKFAAAMAGGNITLDERSMRRILDIGEKAARGKIGLHNELVDNAVKSNGALKDARGTYIVDAPGGYQRPLAAPKAGDVIDGHQFKGGNPRDPKSWGKV